MSTVGSIAYFLRWYTAEHAAEVQAVPLLVELSSYWFGSFGNAKTCLEVPGPLDERG